MARKINTNIVKRQIEETGKWDKWDCGKNNHRYYKDGEVVRVPRHKKQMRESTALAIIRRALKIGILFALLAPLFWLLLQSMS